MMEVEQQIGCLYFFHVITVILWDKIDSCVLSNTLFVIWFLFDTYYVVDLGF